MAKKKNGNTNGKGEFAKRNKSLLGYNSIFTPEVIDDIHIKAQLGRYRMRGMASVSYTHLTLPTICSV